MKGSLRLAALLVLFVPAVAACSSDDGSTLSNGPDSGTTPFDASSSHPVDGAMNHPDASSSVDAPTGTDAAASDSGGHPDAPGAHDASGDTSPPTDAAPPEDAGADAGTDAPSASDSGGVDAGLLPFGSPCTSGAQCYANLCFDFPAKGMFCTQSCSSAADCPGGASGLGCNGMMVCRVQ